MKSSSFSLCLIAAALPTLSWAGNGVGNGGGAIVCRDDHGRIASAELLDYYEGRILRGIQTKLDMETKPYEASVDVVLNRLTPFSPRRAQGYRKEIDEFFSNAVGVRGTHLTVINDTDNLSIPEGCAIEQVVIQRTPEFPEDKKFVIDLDIWDQLPPTSKAGLLLHEAIYSEVIYNYRAANCDGTRCGPLTSVGVRYFNSILSSSALDVYDADHFARLVRLVPYLFRSDTSIFDSDCSVHEIPLEGAEARELAQALKLAGVAPSNGDPLGYSLASLSCTETLPQSTDDGLSTATCRIGDAAPLGGPVALVLTEALKQGGVYGDLAMSRVTYEAHEIACATDSHVPGGLSCHLDAPVMDRCVRDQPTLLSRKRARP